MANVKELNINSTTYDIIGKGVVDQNNTSTPLKQWSGTKAQYDAIVSKDANTIYNITDDTNPTQALLETIYPVGAIYIGTMNICPLSALFGTWTKIGTKILTDVSGSNNVPVKGNGNDLSIEPVSGYSERKIKIEGRSGDDLLVVPDQGNPGVGINAKLITDPTKSGIIADISNSLTKTSITVNIWERTA